MSLNCKHWSPCGLKTGGCCQLHGKISYGVCEKCDDNTSSFWPNITKLSDNKWVSVSFDDSGQYEFVDKTKNKILLFKKKEIYYGFVNTKKGNILLRLSKSSFLNSWTLLVILDDMHIDDTKRILLVSESNKISGNYIDAIKHTRAVVEER